MRLRVTQSADRDIVGILRTTAQTFGHRQVVAYATIVDAGISLLASDPAALSSRDRSDIAAGLRSLHLERVTGRRGSAAHMIYYAISEAPNGEPEIVVLRILHEKMDPHGRLLRELRTTERRPSD